ncbi:MAG: hypothetical protein KDM91_08815 [Verrucomicrobiae bacterium]|nr:hypothetical protein [Verrucomicrobiae bacterium]MCP5538794.1 hypothetical protein [Akkermansiaceae bacterium]MCP5549553.1 hypothetical protein [Akkermansiaceae bacterium]
MKRSHPYRDSLAIAAALVALGFAHCGTAHAQLGPKVVPIRKSKADREESSLIKEDGAVYLEGLVKKTVKVKISKIAPVYANLTGERWLGNLVADQEAELLAIGEKAYRVRARAQQGTVVGWVGIHAVEGVSDELKRNLTKLHERHLLVRDLIDQQQVALGMTIEEVMESLGRPDKRNSKVDKEGRSDVLEYITYERVPQTTTALDRFGRPYQSVTYLKVETGRVSIAFEKEIVSSIEESEGSDFNQGAVKIVPPPIVLF